MSEIKLIKPKKHYLAAARTVVHWIWLSVDDYYNIAFAKST